ncbi:hypothetical protein CVT24_002156 [Panaeolus cyanescens]|uniref:F-box domain-containing protein n=1 Tax=Panaeolus cyanescens TaxID=181874 RepID=A0A409YHX5_9AGAR|nr:hypothetical protein CVT24_002156 [Panaeolus cyanescens]
MPPRTRSNRAALTQLESMRASGRPINSTGFAALPNEIYGEIASHIPSVSVSCHSIEEHEELTRKNASSDKFERHFTLHNLSITCRALRPVFQRYLWQTIEVFDSFKLIDGRSLPSWCKRMVMGYDNTNLKLYAEELLRQLEVVTVRDTSLAQHVNYPNGVMLNWKAILADWEDLQNHFPNVRRAYLDQYTIPFASIFHNLETLSFVNECKIFGRHYYRFTSWDWKCIGERTVLSVTVLGTIAFRDNIYTDRKAFRNLQDITIDCRLAELLVKNRHMYKLWEDFKQLRIIRIRADQMFRDVRGFIVEIPEAETITEWVKWAEDILLQVQRHDKEVKKVYLTKQGGNGTLHILAPGIDAQVLSLSSS